MHYARFKKVIGICFVTVVCLTSHSQAQTHVLLDNFFNHEVNAQTGEVFHYLWSDTANSGYSQWGDIFKAQGAMLDTLQSAPSAARLKQADIYLIVDPDTRAESPDPNYISAADIQTVAQWVSNGGVLVLLANDSGNCEFTHLNRLAGKFGIHFNETSVNPVIGQQWNMGAITQFPDYPVFVGLRKIYLKGISSLTVTPPARAVLTKGGEVLMAESHVGKGYVLALGDPWIYNEYIGHKYLPTDFENQKAAENFTTYLIKLAAAAH
jgi:unsaturated rhamnogalacturonyl hydrolase